MLHMISISEPVYNLLDQEAKRTRLPPNDLAERLLAERLSAEQQAWRQQFDSLLTRVHARLSAFDPAEIEADITAASEEVKAERRANRRSR